MLHYGMEGRGMMRGYGAGVVLGLLGAAAYALAWWLTPVRGLGFDELAYLELARLQAAGEAWGMVERPPLLWWTLGRLQGAGLDAYAAGIAGNVLFAGLFVFALVRLAGRRWWLAPLVIACMVSSRWVRYWGWCLMPELPAVALTTCAVLALLRGRPLLAGVLVGVAALARPEAALLVGVFAAAALCCRWGWKPAVLVGVGCALALAPWAARNQLAVRRFVPVSNNMALNVWQGNALGATWPGDRIMLAAYERDIVPALTIEVLLEQHRFPEGAARAALWRNLPALPEKALRLWWGRDFHGMDTRPRGALLLLCLAGLAGMVYGCARRDPLALIACGWILAYTGMAAIVFPMVRLQIAAMPALALGAYALAGLPIVRRPVA